MYGKGYWQCDRASSARLLLALGPQLVRVFFLVDVLIVAVDFLKPSFKLQMGVEVGSSV